MQITINVPDNLPQAIIQEQIKALEEKLKQQATKEAIPTKQTRKQAIMQISKKCARLPTLDDRSSDEICGVLISRMGKA
jgi:hypothetical protein